MAGGRAVSLDGEAGRLVCWLVVEDGEAGREAVSLVYWLVVQLSAWMVRMVVRLSARTDGWWSSCQLGW